MSTEPISPLGLAVCQVCQAVVNREAFELHVEWHRVIDSWLHQHSAERVSR